MLDLHVAPMERPKLAAAIPFIQAFLEAHELAFAYFGAVCPVSLSSSIPSSPGCWPVNLMRGHTFLASFSVFFSRIADIAFFSKVAEAFHLPFWKGAELTHSQR